MIERREFWKYLKCGAMLTLLPTASSAQEPAAVEEDRSDMMERAIGKSVLDSIKRYEDKTGDPASTVLIHLTDAISQSLPAETGPETYTQLNQQHFSFTIEIEGASGTSK